MKTLNVGDTVTVNCPTMPAYHGKAGQVQQFYGMVSAARIKRVKITVRFPHSRTKTKTVDVAMEIDQLNWDRK